MCFSRLWLHYADNKSGGGKMATANVTVADHPLIQHKLTLLRRTKTSTAEFRQLLGEIALLLAFEATRDLAVRNVRIETPLEVMEAPILDGKKLCLVSILRAGNGLLEGMLDLIPSARVGHIGMYRDHETLKPVEYYLKLPHSIGERQVIVVDPMLATGNSAAAAVTRLKEAGARRIKFVSLVSAPEGIEAFSTAHPDVPILTAAIDRQLSDIGYILPGLGDAGDRLYGTK